VLASALALLALAACAGNSPTFTTGGVGGLIVNGDPTSLTGAPWTFQQTIDGVAYDLTGVLYRPNGTGPFPAVILSHGSDGSAAFLASILAPTMVQWGLVVIAVNYTHAAGVPIGSPGDATQPGASSANVERAYLMYRVLRGLAYVDTLRIALHGHSMGAYVSTAVAGAHPGVFRVASTTGGGVRPIEITIGPAPSPGQALPIQTPFQMHHGDADTEVPLSYDVRFDSLLTATGVEHELFVYPGEDHLQVRADPVMLERVRTWYQAHGMFSAGVRASLH
jgi:dienelactone hydrolase